MGLFFRPADGFVGDVIPFYWQGVYHAFYLKAPLPPAREGANHTPYAHLVSHDLVHWEEWPLAIAPGPEGAPDEVSCFTGSVIEHNGLFYLYYTGYPGRDKPQTICLATSRDLRTWEKDPRNPLLPADPRWYEAVDWRDPFPFWNEATGEFWMIMAARALQGPDQRRGCVALATSPDLEQWEVRAPFWAPQLYFTHECPDLFRWGDQWVMLYSTFSERHITHYRMSDSLQGPWRAPHDDAFDTRAFYAAKTASDGERRFIFGWLPTREGETDDGRWQWAGHLVVHEIVAREDGGLGVKMPPELDQRFTPAAPVTLAPKLGQWQTTGDQAIAAPTDGFAACSLGPLPTSGRVDVTIDLDDAHTRAVGVLLRADDALEHYYQVRWEPGAARLVFDRWPRPGDLPFMFERPLAPDSSAPDSSTRLRLQIVVDESAIVIYANDTVALSTRGYDHIGGDVGIFVAEGGATFRDLRVYSAA